MFCSSSSFNSTGYPNENERYKIYEYIYLFMNINNNTAPFVSIIWHQKEPLGCIVYSHCPTNDPYNKWILCCCCLPCNYVTKPFRILQGVIKSQKVCKSFGLSKSWYLFFKKSLWLNVQTCFWIFRSNGKVII